MSLLCRLSTMPPSWLAALVLERARVPPGSWSHGTLQVFSTYDMIAPADFGLTRESPAAWRRRFVHEVVRPRLVAADVQMWHDNLGRYTDEALVTYGEAMGQLVLSCVHSWGIPAHHAAAWGRLRSGSGCLGAQRVARHTNASAACLLCGGSVGDLAHCLLWCPALSREREAWWSQVSAALGLNRHASFPTAVPVQLFVSPSSAPLASAHAAFVWAIEFAHRQ